MVKKLFTVLLCMLLPLSALAEDLLTDNSLSLLTGAAATADTAQVLDHAAVLSASEEAAIAEVIGQIERDHQVDIIVMTTRDVPYDFSEDAWRVQSYADDYFDNAGWGMGPDFSGMLYMIDLTNRVQCISTGGVMIDYITDAREEAIFDDAATYLRFDEWGNAALAAVRRTSRFMDEGRQRGFFRYDEATGERMSGYYNPLLLSEVLIALGGGLLAAGIMVGTVGGVYGLKGGTYQYDAAANASCTLTRDEEQYLRESISRVARSSGTAGSMHGGSSGGRSGGSGVRRSSSGRSHGGGARRF